MTKFSTLPGFNQNLHITDRFYPGAKELRSVFESRFANPYQATSDRFCWDYWHIRDQYKLFRTPAEAFFGRKKFQPFLEHLLNWGRRNLGCQMISHPWLSVYLDGCHQALHSDVPHGPYSFVYSLTPWKNRTFKGGETLVAKPKLLNYFNELRHDQSHENRDFFDKIAPEMNRLTVFDPRYPHGVQMVQGADELQNGRLVIHGWFTEPRPMIEGSLSVSKISKSLDAFAYQTIELIEPLQYHGLLTLRLTIAPTGKIESIAIMNAHLINSVGQVIPTPILKKLIQSIDVHFAKSSSKTTITLPIEFKK